MKYTKYKLIGGLDQLEIESVSDDIKVILSTEQETLKEYNAKTKNIYQNIKKFLMEYEKYFPLF